MNEPSMYHHKNVQLILHPVYRDDSCQMQAITNDVQCEEFVSKLFLLVLHWTWFSVYIGKEEIQWKEMAHLW